MGASGRLGYEYGYRFSVDEEILPHYNYELFPEEKTLILEIRTSFSVETNDGGGSSDIINSERFGNSNLYDGKVETYGENYLLSDLRTVATNRLFDYGMSEDDVIKFENEVAGFMRNAENAPRSVVPVVVDFEVRTVQRGDEGYAEVMERAIRVEKMVPLCFYGYYTWDFEERAYDLERRSFINKHLTWIRADISVDGATIMESCGICLNGAVVGNEISFVPCCKCAFHSHCIVRWFMDEDLCPRCKFDMFGFLDF